MQILGEGKFLRLIQEGRWEYVKRTNCNGIVSILAVTEDQKIILTEQYRSSLHKKVIEMPAGLANDQGKEKLENLEEAAERELFEETGYEAKSFTFLIEGPPSAGLSTETIHFFKANGLKKTGPGGGDESEEITVHEIALSAVDSWLQQMQKKGCLIDPKLYVGLYFARCRGNSPS